MSTHITLGCFVCKSNRKYIIYEAMSLGFPFHNVLWLIIIIITYHYTYYFIRYILIVKATKMGEKKHFINIYDESKFKTRYDKKSLVTLT